MTIGYVGPGGQWVSVADTPASAGGRALIASLAGPYSVNTLTQNLVGFPGGPPKVPAGTIRPGLNGGRLRIYGELTKTGAAGNLNGDVRFGTASSFTDTQMCNLANMGGGASAYANFELWLFFPTSTSCVVSQQLTYASGASPADGYFPNALADQPTINTDADMFVNVGFNGATAGDGVEVRNLTIELFR